jgi:hypothetical protein
MIPKSGNRFSGKIMLNTEIEPHPDFAGMEQALADFPDWRLQLAGICVDLTLPILVQ